jgi:hypothetical protein
LCYSPCQACKHIRHARCDRARACSCMFSLRGIVCTALAHGVCSAHACLCTLLHMFVCCTHTPTPPSHPHTRRGIGGLKSWDAPFFSLTRDLWMTLLGVCNPVLPSMTSMQTYSPCKVRSCPCMFMHVLVAGIVCTGLANGVCSAHACLCTLLHMFVCRTPHPPSLPSPHTPRDRRIESIGMCKGSRGDNATLPVSSHTRVV